MREMGKRAFSGRDSGQAAARELHLNCDDHVPAGYWEKLVEFIRRAPLLPDDDKSGDPPPFI